MHCGSWSLIGFTQIKLVISANSAERVISEIDYHFQSTNQFAEW